MKRVWSSIVDEPSKSLLSFRREMAQPRLSMATRGLDSQIGGGGGKVEGRHILIIALSEH